MSELFFVYGKTDGTSTTGTFTLNSDIFSGATYIRLPKGSKAKIWFKKIAGAVATDIVVQMTQDITQATPTWTDIGIEKLTGAGQIEYDVRKPIIVRGITGKEAIRFTWSQGTAGDGYIEAIIEITED